MIASCDATTEGNRMTSLGKEPETATEDRSYRSWHATDRTNILKQTKRIGLIRWAILAYMFGLTILIFTAVVAITTKKAGGEGLSVVQLTVPFVLFMGALTVSCILSALSQMGRTRQHKLMEEEGEVRTFTDPADQLLAETLLNRYHWAICSGSRTRDARDLLLSARYNGLQAIEWRDDEAYQQALADINSVAERTMRRRSWL